MNSYNLTIKYRVNHKMNQLTSIASITVWSSIPLILSTSKWYLTSTRFDFPLNCTAFSINFNRTSWIYEAKTNQVLIKTITNSTKVTNCLIIDPMIYSQIIGSEHSVNYATNTVWLWPLKEIWVYFYKKVWQKFH